jgi:hypothetical protein
LNYDELIRNWHTKVSGEDYFSKFIFQYLAFIAFVKKKKFTNTRTDREAIQKLKRDAAIQYIYLEKIETDTILKDSWLQIIEELSQARLGNMNRNTVGEEDLRWWNCSSSHFDQKDADDQEKSAGVVHDLTDWRNMVEFWYAIRNNLFHGGKNPQDKRDHLFVTHGFITLKPLVQAFLELGSTSLEEIENS